jgi:hypothetical protein
MMWVGYTALLLCAVSFGLFLSERVKTPFLMDVGLVLMSFGMLAVAYNVLTGTPCNPAGIAIRWIFNGGGVFCVLVSLWRLLHESRIDKTTVLQTKDFRHVSGGKIDRS